ncbi:MAG: hypothetical protein WBB37_07410 [bacterium]
MIPDRDLNPAEKAERLQILDEKFELLDEFIDKDKLIAASPAIQNLIFIVSILGQFVKNHEALFFSFFEKYKEG